MSGSTTEHRDKAQEKQMAAEAGIRRVVEETEAERAAKEAEKEAEKALNAVVAAGGTRAEVKEASARARKARNAVEDATNIRRAAEAALNGPKGHKVKLHNARIYAVSEEWGEVDVAGVLARVSKAGAAFVGAIGEFEDLMERYKTLRNRRSAAIGRISDLGGSTPPKLPPLPDPMKKLGLPEREFRSLVASVKRLTEAAPSTDEDEPEQQEDAA